MQSLEKARKKTQRIQTTMMASRVFCQEILIMDLAFVTAHFENQGVKCNLAHCANMLFYAVANNRSKKKRLCVSE